MAETSLREELTTLIDKREATHSRIQVLRGQLESARNRVQEVETEVRGRGIEPAKLEETIQLLEDKGREELARIREELEAADEKLSPFTTTED
jgi:chromosome segregation ATPase